MDGPLEQIFTWLSRNISMKVTYGPDGWPVGLKTGQLYNRDDDKPIYCAKNNDTPRQICKSFGQNLSQFLKVNRRFYGILSPSSRFRTNTLVVLPSKRTTPKKKRRRTDSSYSCYKTQDFDTIVKIAKRFHCRPDLIVSLNKKTIKDLHSHYFFKKPTTLKVPKTLQIKMENRRIENRRTRQGDAFQAEVETHSPFDMNKYRRSRHSILGKPMKWKSWNEIWRVHIFLTERAHLSRSDSTPRNPPPHICILLSPTTWNKARAKCFDNLKTHWLIERKKCQKKHPTRKKLPYK